MQIIASLLSTLLSLYSMAIVIRIVLSWGGSVRPASVRSIR